MLMFGRKKCNHENTQTITNIFGDMINHFKGRRYVNCIDCGKEILKPDLDFKCHESNQFGTKLFYLKSHDGIKGVSDGDNTFNDLYNQRTILLATICSLNKEYAHKVTPANWTDKYFLLYIKIKDTMYYIKIGMKYWGIFNIKLSNEIDDAVELNSDNFDVLSAISYCNKKILIGDVYEDIYDHVVINIKDDKYRIRACYPDSMEEYEVSIDWFKTANYKKHIELK